MTSQPGKQTITIHILPNISRSKSNQTIKFGQSIKYNKRKIFFENLVQNEVDCFSRLLFVFKKALQEVKASRQQLSFNIFRQPSIQRTIQINCVKRQITNPEICSILILQKRVWGQFLNHILGVIFQEKSFSCYILLTDQICPV